MILNLPFAALRAFEVVARHGSFSGAALELGISQSAVSQHVRTLEEWLGHPLVRRGARQSVPTPDGMRLARAVADGLGRISDVCEDIRDKRRVTNTIVINCLPGFAFVWLFPRLVRFDLAHPDLSISISTDTGADALRTGQADIAVLYGPHPPPGLHVEALMGEDLFPVCAPALLDGDPPLRDLADLARHTQLRDDVDTLAAAPPSWEFWAHANDLNLPRPARIRRFGQSNMVLQAATQGLGVALGRGPLAIDALVEGRLVRPFPQIATSEFRYWLACARGAETSAKIRLFLDWMKKEVAEQPALPAAVARPGDGTAGE